THRAVERLTQLGDRAPKLEIPHEGGTFTKGQRAGEELEGEHAEGEEICARIGDRAADELRGQVGRSFEDQACRRPRRQDIEARESDLDQPWPAVGVEADLSRLEAPNDPPAVVDRLEEIRDPTQEREACVEVRGRTPRDPGAKARRVGAIGGDLEGPTAEP